MTVLAHRNKPTKHGEVPRGIEGHPSEQSITGMPDGGRTITKATEHEKIRYTRTSRNYTSVANTSSDVCIRELEQGPAYTLDNRILAGTYSKELNYCGKNVHRTQRKG